jgi:hypothetical protein
MSRDLQMLLAAVTHLVEGLSVEALLNLKVEMSVICLVRTRRPTVNFVLEIINKKYIVKALSPGIKRFKM